MDRELIFCLANIKKTSVGGRRWRILIESLDSKNIDFRILTKKGLLSGNDRFFEERTEYIPELGGWFLSKSNNRFVYALQFRLKRILSKVLHKGFISDTGILSKHRIVSQLKKGYDLNNSIVITSGWPFSWATELAKIKDEFGFKLVVDIRDSWGNSKHFDSPLVTNKILEFEKSAERQCFEKADLIITASIDITKEVSAKFQEKTFTLMNCIENNLQSYEAPENEQACLNKVNFCHIGNVNSSANHHWRKFFSDIPDHWKFSFYGNVNPELINELNSHPNVEMKKRLSKPELFKVLPSYDAFLIFKDDNLADSFPSKYFDYIVFRKPIIIFSAEGIVTKEIVQNRIGANQAGKSAKASLNDVNFILKEFNRSFNIIPHTSTDRVNFLIDLLQRYC